jgi:hypothetical protein
MIARICFSKLTWSNNARASEDVVANIALASVTYCLIAVSMSYRKNTTQLKFSFEICTYLRIVIYLA